MNDNFNNQNPQGNNGPDFSYNWNGSEHNNKNGGNGGKDGNGGQLTGGEQGTVGFGHLENLLQVAKYP